MPRKKTTAAEYEEDDRGTGGTDSFTNESQADLIVLTIPKWGTPEYDSFNIKLQEFIVAAAEGRLAVGSALRLEV